MRPAYIASVERGELNPQLATLHRLAGVLGVPIGVLAVTSPALDGAAGDAELISCPGCDVTTRLVTRAYEAGVPCPECGLPAAATEQVMSVRRSGMTYRRICDNVLRRHRHAPERDGQDPRVTFGSRARGLRVERDLSRDELARLSRMTWSVLAKIENGHRNVALSTIYDLAAGLAVPPRDLLP